MIKGNISLPRNCGVCPLNCLGVCLAKNSKTDVIKYLKKRRNDCPLVEIPTPHGRLIDADFLIHMLNLALMPIRCSAGVDIDSMNEDQKIFVRTVINQIKSAPTVIEAEVSE